MIPLPEDWHRGWFQGWFDLGWFDYPIENLRHGTTPVFYPIIHPFYFDTGVAAGSGAFVNVTFIAPDRLQVDQGAGAALWTSPVLEGHGKFPATVTPTWIIESPGYYSLVEYRTGPSSAACEAAAWITLINNEPISLQRYYQWRVGWISVRSWFFEHEEEIDESAFWFLEDYDPEDSYQSYFTEGEIEGVAYLEQMRFTTEYEIPQENIRDRGSCIDEAAQEFGELTAGDLTLTLLNRDNLYNPDVPEFLFGGDNYWYKKGLRLEMAYGLTNGQTTSRIIIWQGLIDDWGPVLHRVDEGGKFDEHTVEIVARCLLSELADLKIGMPDDDGSPNPLVFGEILRQLEQVGDDTLGEPDGTANFNEGDFEELTGVDTGGGGVVELEAIDPYDGPFSMKTKVAAAGAFAKGRLDLLAASSEILFGTWLKFTSLPETPLNLNMHFMGLYNAAGDEVVKFYVGSDYRVHVYAWGAWKETDWYVNQDMGVYKRVSIGVFGANPGTLKTWVNGNEILTWDENWSAASLKGGFLGPHNSAAEDWEIVSDAWEIYPNFWPQLFKAPGGPYDAIGTIYLDGAIKLANNSTRVRRGLTLSAPGPAAKFVGGTATSANLEKYPQYGAVAFTDYSAKEGGTVMAYLRRNSVTHWADIAYAVIAAAGKEDLINAESFAAAKAACPNDSLGCYFEETTVGDVLKALAAAGLFTVFLSQGQIKLQPYTGQAPAEYDLELDEFEFVGGDPKTDIKGIKNQIIVKYGWYERNNRLLYKASDEVSIGRLGILAQEIDYSWGSGAVGSDNTNMAKQKADLLLSRLGNGCRRMEGASSSLRLARVEPEDIIRLNVAYFGAPTLWRVAKKTIRMEPPYGVDLSLVRYLGEET